MIPLPVILAEFVMAFGAAFLIANAVALIRTSRERFDADDADAPKPRARGRMVANMLIGAVVFAWGLATFLVRLTE